MTTRRIWIRLYRWLALMAAVAPAVWLAWRAWAGRLGADPVETLLHTTGSVAFVLLLATLALGPVARLAGYGWLAAPRRWLGILTCLWAAGHFGVWLGLDQFFAWGFAWQEFQGRAYLWWGAGALVILLMLGVTSTDGWQRRLGPGVWTGLHRLSYVAAVAALIHIHLQTRADYLLVYVYTGGLAVLIAARLAAALGLGWRKRIS